eukprot:GHVS01107727.1.p1 GENE.GHVS01107727.1~~GHVS01107727.1.p1  ORF type:complete len:139 (+),score=44.12 GHVS01107727.1:988-1404(+)
MHIIRTNNNMTSPRQQPLIRLCRRPFLLVLWSYCLYFATYNVSIAFGIPSHSPPPIYPLSPAIPLPPLSTKPTSSSPSAPLSSSSATPSSASPAAQTGNAAAQTAKKIFRGMVLGVEEVANVYDDLIRSQQQQMPQQQ